MAENYKLQCTYSPKGWLIFSQANMLYILDINTKKYVLELELPDIVEIVTINDGKLAIAISNANILIKIYDLKNFTHIIDIDDGDFQTQVVHMQLIDNKLIARIREDHYDLSYVGTYEDTYVYVYDFLTNIASEKVRGNYSCLYALSYDSKIFYDDDNSLEMSDFVENQITIEKFKYTPVTNIKISQELGILYSGWEHGIVLIYDIKTPIPYILHEIKVADKSIVDICFTDNMLYIATNDTVYVYKSYILIGTILNSNIVGLDIIDS